MSYLGLLLAFRIPLYVQLLLNILISKMVSPQVVLRALGGLLHVSICDLLPQASPVSLQLSHVEDGT